MKGTKGQHTVAQSCLRRFTADGSQIYAFDKTTGRVFYTNVANVAKEAYFYDLPAEIMNEAVKAGAPKEQFMEKLLAAVDGYAKTQIDEILESVKRDRPIAKDHRRGLATVMAVQFSRTALNRQLLREGHEKLSQAIVEEMIQRQFPNEAPHVDIRVEFDNDTWALQQAHQLLSEDHMVKVASALASHIWLFGVNKTIQPLYTSDHPVVRNAHCRSRGVELTGLLAPGVEIVFPLNSDCVLYMLEQTYFRHMKKMDGRTMRLDPFDIEHFNALQVRRSFRQVYCEKNEFDQARGVCKRYPECCDLNRSRVEIVNSGNLIALFNRE